MKWSQKLLRVTETMSYRMRERERCKEICVCVRETDMVRVRNRI